LDEEQSNSIMDKPTQAECPDKVPWLVAFVLFTVVEGALWAILAAFGAEEIARGLLLVAIAFWVTFLAVAPTSFLAIPAIAEEIGVKNVWVARTVCAVVSIVIWIIVIIHFAPAWGMLIIGFFARFF
jgi:hypothetical protein